MSDDLDRLRAGLSAAPLPDPGRKAQAMARAMAEFERVQAAPQGSARDARHRKDRPTGAGSFGRLRAMFAPLTTRGSLAAGASLATLAIALFVVMPDLPGPGRMPETAPPAPPVAETPTADAPRLAPEVAEVVVVEPVVGGAMPAADAEVAASEDARLQAPAMILASPPPPGTPPLRSAARLGRAEGGSPVVIPPVVGDPGIQTEVPVTDAFPEAEPNPLKITAESPVSTFSVDVDTASYAVVRSFLTGGQVPPPEAVRIEEMVNYFPYDWPAPAAGEGPFRPTVTMMPTPWNDGTRLVTIALQGQQVTERPPLNLVFLVDTSGSMQDANKLPLLTQSLRLMLAELRPEDQVAIVAYAGSAGEVLPPTPATDRDAILAALDRLQAGGSTAGGEGLRLAYATAARMAEDGELGRVILATDGDFNVGIHEPGELERFIEKHRDSGTYLSVLGFGRGNLDDAAMQALAQAGNGNAAYIDTLSEARKVLVDEVAGALFPIADDVKVQVEWNPATVAEYRLIGYETRALAREDFANDRVDAGEIGAGHRVTALYEITPVGSPARLTEDLRYAPQPDGGPGDELGFLRLRWKAPGGDASQLLELPIVADAAEGGEDARFAAAIAGFGQLLGDGRYLGDWGWDQAIDLAVSARGDDPFGYRAEAVTLMRLARDLSR
jgi:Ca-activated chloride channel homolog